MVPLYHYTAEKCNFTTKMFNGTIMFNSGKTYNDQICVRSVVCTTCVYVLQPLSAFKRPSSSRSKRC